MSDTNNQKQTLGVTAEFTEVDALLAAANRLREAGYKKIDAYTPFPIHGIDKALGIAPTKLPFISLAGGLSGLTIALVMQIWMNSIDYPYIISGKPFISLPAFIPVAFELTILLSAFGAFFGMLALNGLPKFSNPMFTNPRFDRATDDTFFLYVDAKDALFDEAGVKKLLAEIGGAEIDVVVEDATPEKLPGFIVPGLVIAGTAALIPLMVFLQIRLGKSRSPRLHVFFDMDYSPAKRPQWGTTLFADGRANRPDVIGTVARGQAIDLDYSTGIDMQKLSMMDPDRATRLVSLVEEGEKDPSAGEGKDEPADNTPWLSQNQEEVDLTLLNQGQKIFNIYCAVCHGENGRGNGLVNKRAQALLQPTWVQPSSIQDPSYHADKYPDGKLYNTITNGIRKMPGYAGQIYPKDRWAVVAYVRALQRSGDVSIDDVAPSKREGLLKEQLEVKEEIKEREAAAARRRAALEAAQGKTENESDAEASAVPAENAKPVVEEAIPAEAKPGETPSVAAESGGEKQEASASSEMTEKPKAEEGTPAKETPAAEAVSKADPKPTAEEKATVEGTDPEAAEEMKPEATPAEEKKEEEPAPEKEGEAAEKKGETETPDSESAEKPEAAKAESEMKEGNEVTTGETPVAETEGKAEAKADEKPSEKEGVEAKEAASETSTEEPAGNESTESEEPSDKKEESESEESGDQ